MDRQETFKIEEIKERAKFLERSNELFKGQGQVLMTCSDCLTYVFDTVCEAVIFIIHRVKETEDDIPPHHFKEAFIMNIGSPDICIRITTDEESYICKTLESYRYQQESERIRKEHESERIRKEQEEEIDYMLSGNHERFMDSLKAKASLIKLEFKNFNFDKKESFSSLIIHILNRYFGDNGWLRYWFTSRPLNKISVEVTLNVLLSDGDTVINIPSDKPVKAKNLKMIEERNNHGK